MSEKPKDETRSLDESKRVADCVATSSLSSAPSSVEVARRPSFAGRSAIFFDNTMCFVAMRDVFADFEDESLLRYGSKLLKRRLELGEPEEAAIISALIQRISRCDQSE